MTLHKILGALLALGAGPLFADERVDAPTGQLVSNDYDYYGAHGHAAHAESWQSAYGAFGAELNCRDTGTTGPRRVFYPIHVPEGHTLAWIDTWGWDNSSNDLVLRLLKVCQGFLTPGVPVVSQLGIDATTGMPQRFWVDVLVADVATPGTCGYVLEARFAADGVACTGSSLGLLRIRAQVRDPDLLFRSGFFLSDPPAAPTLDPLPGAQP